MGRRIGTGFRGDRRGLGSGGGFVPTQLSGCVFWLRADMGITKDGSNKVSAWADQTGNGHHHTNGVAAQQPTFTETGLGGRPMVYSDGSDVLYTTTLPWPVDAETVFWVGMSKAGHAGEYFSAHQGGGDVRHHFYGGSPTQFKRWSTGPSATLVQDTPVMISYTGVGTAEEMWKDGVSVGTTSVRPVTAPLTYASCLFAGATSGAFPGVQGTSALLLYNRVLNTSERKQVEQYLRQEWGTP